MGHIESTRVDTAAVLGAAQRYDAVAGLLDAALQRHLSGLSFGGANAGREYLDGGEAVRRAVGQTVEQVRVWARTSREIAGQLRVSTRTYEQVDAHGADRIG